MNEYSLFRLKLQYKTDNQETGDVEKAKMEILAQCVNYTDAEKVVNKIAKLYNMNKYEPMIYEIVKTKFDATQIVADGVLQTEYMEGVNQKLTCGLVQHFFENENEGLFAVDTTIFGNKEEKEKDVKTTYFIPAINVADAHDRAKKVLAYNGHDLDDCLVSGAKLDKAEYIYLRPSTSESLYNKATQIFG